MPRHLEPKLCIRSDKPSLPYEYQASWNEYHNGEVVKVARRYSCEKHGKLGAYSLAKAALQEAHKEHLELLQFMGRASLIQLK